MKLEVGKRYVTRNGQVTGPVRASGGSLYPFEVDLGCVEGELYTDEGFYYWDDKGHDIDLVSEYIEEPQFGTWYDIEDAPEGEEQPLGLLAEMIVFLLWPPTGRPCHPHQRKRTKKSKRTKHRTSVTTSSKP